jgi:phosphoserine phosphatase
LNTSLIEDIKHNGGDYLSIGITSGILEVWKKVQEKYNFPCIITGGSNLKIDNIIVSKAVKFYLVKLLREEGKYVIAVGDSMVDIDMLNEAHEGFIIAQEKINTSIEAYFKTIKTGIMQPEYNKNYYDDISIKRSIFYEHNLSS